MEKGIPHLTRAQLLGQIMQNYDTPIAAAVHMAKPPRHPWSVRFFCIPVTDPTLSIGGMLNSIGGNIRVGSTDLRYRSMRIYQQLLKLFPKLGIILNIDEDHLDFFKDIDDIRQILSINLQSFCPQTAA